MDFDRIGELIGGQARRRAWRDFVMSLHESSQPGGPLEGWAFHGTTVDRAGLIMEKGLIASTALADSGAMAREWVEGTHWGTPTVAAFYAEDLIESFEDPNLELAIVAIRMSDLVEYGEAVVDGQTVDCPLYSRLDLDEKEVDRRWGESNQGWEACWEILGTVLVLGDVHPESLVLLRGVDDLDDLLTRVAAPSTVP